MCLRGWGDCRGITPLGHCIACVCELRRCVDPSAHVRAHVRILATPMPYDRSPGAVSLVCLSSAARGDLKRALAKPSYRNESSMLLDFKLAVAARHRNHNSPNPCPSPQRAKPPRNEGCISCPVGPVDQIKTWWCIRSAFPFGERATTLVEDFLGIPLGRESSWSFLKGMQDVCAHSKIGGDSTSVYGGAPGRLRPCSNHSYVISTISHVAMDACVHIPVIQ